MKKYFKLLLIPIITLMLFIPVKAENIELPYDDVFTDKNYIVASVNNVIWRVSWDKGSADVDNFYYAGVSNMIWVHTKSNGSFSDNSSLKSEFLNNGSWVNKNVVKDRIGQYIIGSANSGTLTIHYSNVYIPAQDFQPAPVLTLAQLREKVTGAAIMEMGETVTVASGEILVVGGLILGAVFLVLLVARLLRWGTHSVR